MSCVQELFYYTKYLRPKLGGELWFGAQHAEETSVFHAEFTQVGDDHKHTREKAHLVGMVG